jgi:hypothetical protein
VRYYDQVTLVAPPAPTVDPVTGNESVDWATATRTSVAGSVQPLSSSESTADEQVTITRWRLFCPPVPMTAEYRVEWDGDSFEVDGEVGVWKRRGTSHHVEAVLRRVEG